MLTHGKLLQIVEEKLIRHSLFDAEDNSKILSVITYTFESKNGSTILQAQEELQYEMTDEQHNDAQQGWDAALSLVKDIAEIANHGLKQFQP